MARKSDAFIAVGDVLITPATGAYGHSMASNYNLVPRPAVVFVRDGRARVVVRRETIADLVARDVTDDTTEVAEGAAKTGLVVAGIGVVIVAFLLGRRRGHKKSTIIEVRRV